MPMSTPVPIIDFSAADTGAPRLGAQRLRDEGMARRAIAAGEAALMLYHLQGDTAADISAIERLRACGATVIAVGAVSDEMHALLFAAGAEVVVDATASDTVLAAHVAAATARGECQQQLLAEVAAAREQQLLAEHMVRLMVPVSAAAMAGTDVRTVTQLILQQALQLSRAEGGTIYSRTTPSSLQPTFLCNTVLGIDMAEPSDHVGALPLPPESGQPVVAAACVLYARSINIDDPYADDPQYDLSGVRVFDAENNYRTRSLLAVPLRSTDGHIIGALQLVNAHAGDGVAEPFSAQTQHFVEQLATLAAASLAGCMRIEQLHVLAEQSAIHVNRRNRDEEVREIVRSPMFERVREQAAQLRARKKRPA
jgi:hypothetical protein